MKSVAFVDQCIGIHSIDVAEVQAGALARNHPDFKGRILKHQMGKSQRRENDDEKGLYIGMPRRDAPDDGPGLSLVVGSR
jgi:hypothetical protein